MVVLLQQFLMGGLGILIGVLGAGGLGRRRGSLAFVAIGAALAPAGTSLGILAAPLAILRANFQPTPRAGSNFPPSWPHLRAYSRTSSSATWADPNRRALRGCRTSHGRALGGPGIRNLRTWPDTVADDARRTGFVAGGAPLAPLRLGGRNRGAGGDALFAEGDERQSQAGLGGAAMIYCGYLLTYVPRVWMLRMGRWSELQLLYQAVGRYHVLPLMGLAAIIAAVIAGWPLVRGCDARRAAGGRRRDRRVGDAGGSIQRGQILGFLPAAAGPENDLRSAAIAWVNWPRKKASPALSS